MSYIDRVGWEYSTGERHPIQQAIFLDVDGTICNYEGKIPDSAVRAIRAARARRHLVYLCTGRSRAEVYRELWDIGFDGLIGGNGSYVEHHGQVLLHRLIPEEDSHKERLHRLHAF